MAEQVQGDHDYAEHERTYEGFIRFTIGGILHVILTCICILAMTYIGGFAFWAGLLGLIIGTVVIGMTLIAGLSWTPSLLVLAAVIVFTIVGL